MADKNLEELAQQLVSENSEKSCQKDTNSGAAMFDSESDVIIRKEHSTKHVGGDR